MNLPFTHDQFLEVFQQYNLALWPFVLFLWLLTVGAFLYLYRRGTAESSRLIAGLLVLLWAWGGVAYHLAFFQHINPAANIFAGLFLIQALLFLWRGVIQPHLTFTPSRSLWGYAGLALIAYSLVYPVLGIVFGLVYPRLPSFGVPCPTAILTAGLLLLLPRRQARLVAVIPIVWSVIGGSASFVLSIRADIGLIVAGALLLIYILAPAPLLENGISGEMHLSSVPGMPVKKNIR